MINLVPDARNSTASRMDWRETKNTIGAPFALAPIPISVTLTQGEIEDGWMLLLPVMLLVERERDGWYVVSDELFGVYADAAQLREALRQYVSSLIDHYEFLEREARENPSEAVRRELAFAGRYVRRKAA